MNLFESNVCRPAQFIRSGKSLPLPNQLQEKKFVNCIDVSFLVVNNTL